MYQCSQPERTDKTQLYVSVKNIARSHNNFLIEKEVHVFEKLPHRQKGPGKFPIGKERGWYIWKP